MPHRFTNGATVISIAPCDSSLTSSAAATTFTSAALTGNQSVPRDALKRDTIESSRYPDMSWSICASTVSMVWRTSLLSPPASGGAIFTV